MPLATLERGHEMSLFAIIREAGPGWTDGKGTFEQPAINDHAAFMKSLDLPSPAFHRRQRVNATIRRGDKPAASTVKSAADSVASATGAMLRGRYGKCGARGNRIPVCF
jgi:hypothetical protein